MVGLGPNSAETALVRCAHRSLAVAAFRLRRILAFGRQMKMSVERSETRNERAKHRKRAKHRMRHSEAARPSKRQTAVSGVASAHCSLSFARPSGLAVTHSVLRTLPVLCTLISSLTSFDAHFHLAAEGQDAP